MCASGSARRGWSVKRVAIKRRTPLRHGQPLADAAGSHAEHVAPIRWGGFEIRVRTPLTRGKPLPSRSKDGAKRARVRRRQFGSDEFMDWLHALRCAVPGCVVWKVEAAHARSRGAGGTAADILPLCGGPAGHHAEQHAIGVRTFERKYGFSMREAAARTQREWMTDTR